MPIASSSTGIHENAFDYQLAQAVPTPKSKPLDIQAGVGDIKNAGYQGDLPISPGPDTTEPLDVHEKHMSELVSWWKDLGSRINPKAWEAFLEAQTPSTNIEDRRADDPTKNNALMQMPLDELQRTLESMRKNEPK